MHAIDHQLMGLEHLATAVLALDEMRQTRSLNSAAEHLLGLSASQAIGQSLDALFNSPKQLHSALDYALSHNASFTEHELILEVNANRLQVSCTVTPLENAPVAFMIEFHPMDQQLKIARDERMLLQQQIGRAHV